MSISDDLKRQLATGSYLRGFGQKGGSYIIDTNVHPTNVESVKADGDADTVFAAGTIYNGGSITGFTLKGGDVLYGDFKAIQLTSGKVYAYNKK